MTTVVERVIATYKTLKGALQLALAGAVIVVVLTGHVAALHDVAADIGHHASRAWSIALAHAIVGSVTPHGLNALALALGKYGPGALSVNALRVVRSDGASRLAHCAMHRDRRVRHRESGCASVGVGPRKVPFSLVGAQFATRIGVSWASEPTTKPLR